VTPGRDGFGLHRTYTGLEHDAAGLAPIDLFAEVRDLDIVLVPHGYHGPCAAAPGYPMYYLNVMAGPAAERAWAFCDDPTHAWIRDSWAGQATDPRLPATSAAPAASAPAGNRSSR
jgi:5-deoxy-glucuronate isomerase